METSIIVVYTTKLDAENNLVIENSQGESVTTNSPKQALDFLSKNYAGIINHKWMWDIDQTAAPLFKTLGMLISKEIASEPLREARFKFNNNDLQMLKFSARSDKLEQGTYSVFYRAESQLGITTPNEKYSSYFYNLIQYFDTDEEITDLKVIKEKATELTNAALAIGLRPMKWSSPASLYEDTFLKHLGELVPTLADVTMPKKDTDELADWCVEIMHREFTTNTAVGTWNKGGVYSYDQSSAYGSMFAELQNFKYATFTKSSVAVKDADTGILKGTVTIYPDIKCSPICFKTKQGQTIYPSGCSWETKLTLQEVRWIYRHHIGEFQLERGYFWKFNAKQQPFKIGMQKLYDAREKGGLVKSLAKKVAASAWSKTIQKIGNAEENPYYSPLLAVQVKTNCRLKTADFIYDNNLQDSVISIETDGVRSTKPATREFRIGLGEWQEKPLENCMVISAGAVVTDSKKPRSMYFNEIVDLIKNNPNEMLYTETKLRRLTLDEAVAKKKLENVGNIVPFTTALNLLNARVSQDMDFDEFPNCGQDLLDNKFYGQSVNNVEGK